MKPTLELRPVYHQLERRIRAHVLLCWLALLLVRLAETATGDTWRNLRHEFDRMHRVTLATDDGVVVQRTATTAEQAGILRALKVPEPPRFFDFTATPADRPSRRRVDTRLRHPTRPKPQVELERSRLRWIQAQSPRLHIVSRSWAL